MRNLMLGKRERKKKEFPVSIPVFIFELVFNLMKQLS